MCQKKLEKTVYRGSFFAARTSNFRNWCAPKESVRWSIFPRFCCSTFDETIIYICATKKIVNNMVLFVSLCFVYLQTNPWDSFVRGRADSDALSATPCLVVSLEATRVNEIPVRVSVRVCLRARDPDGATDSYTHAQFPLLDFVRIQFRAWSNIGTWPRGWGEARHRTSRLYLTVS